MLPSPHPAPNSGKTQCLRKQALPFAMRYAEKTLRPALKLGDTPIEVQTARGGTNSLVYFLACEGNRRAVIYLHDDPNDWRDTCDALKLGAREALPIPRLLHSRPGPLLPWKKGYAMLATDFAEGRTLMNLEWDAPRIELLADTVARLHGLESDRWGKMRRLRSDPLLSSLERGIRKRIEKIRHHRSAPNGRILDVIENFFDRQLSDIPEPSNFQLCHHHLFGDDLIISPDEKSITILDCPGVQYSRASRDLASIRQGFFPYEADHWQHFLNAYFGHFPAKTRLEWEREIPIYNAFYLLIKFRNHLGRAKQSMYLERLLSACNQELHAS
jgi:hypothetical protein